MTRLAIELDDADVLSIELRPADAVQRQAVHVHAVPVASRAVAPCAGSEDA